MHKKQFLSEKKQILLRWWVWFCIGNALLLYVIGLKYVPTLFPGEWGAFFVSQKISAAVFVVGAYVEHFMLLAFLPSVFVIPIILLFPTRQRWIFSIAIFLSTLLAFSLVIDTIVYGVYRFHLNGVLIHLVINGLSAQVFEFSWLEYSVGIAFLVGIFGLEYVYANKLWYWITQGLLEQKAKWAAILFGVCLYVSLAILTFNAGSTVGRVLLDVARFLPLYENMLSSVLQLDNGLVTLERLAETNFTQPEQASAKLYYPQEANLQCRANHKPLNLVMIVIDTWRFDMLNAAVMPNLHRFSKGAWTFTQHMSGGNATQPGIFSLFYGLPATYFTSMQKQHRSPVFIDELQRQHYQIGVFSSGSLQWPAFNKTVFSAIKNLSLGMSGATAYQKDQSVTQHFQEFIGQVKANSQPFFSFLFYDSAHSYCEINNNLTPFQPVKKICGRSNLDNVHDPVLYFNRYKNAVLLVDQQVEQVMAVLKKQHLLDKTVIVITGDHGEEFNDNHLGYWRHASNFTHYQVQTPLIIYWPGQAPAVFSHQTSHFDVVPTLMKKLLACDAPSKSYSVGTQLFDKNPRPYLLVGSYIDYGIVEPDRITTIFPLGNFEIAHLNGQFMEGAELRMPIMKQVLTEMHRFYRK